MPSSSERAARILRYLADLAPTGGGKRDVVPRSSEFAYLGWRPDLILPPQPGDRSGAAAVPRTAVLRKLMVIDTLHPAEQLLRVGWLFICGTHSVGDDSTRYCIPLLSAPVAVSANGLDYRIAHLGDVEMPEELFDDIARAALEGSTDPYPDRNPGTNGRLAEEMPEFAAWVQAALVAAGLAPAPLVGPEASPLDLRGENGLRVVAGAAVYPVRDVAAPNVAGTLLGWTSQPLAGTAFDVLYGGDGQVIAAEPEPVRTPLPLNAAQREALERSRRERITVVSGPPGTGKSHLVAAAAIDEVGRGHSVLVATQSDYAAAVIADLLDRNPGPRYVRFGSRDARESVAADLSDGLAQPLPHDEFATRSKRAEDAGARVRSIRHSITKLLEREVAFTEGLGRRELNLLITAEAPGVSRPGFDLASALRLLDRAGTTAGFLGGWRRRRAVGKLRKVTAAEPGASVEDLSAAVEAAAAEAAVQRGLTGGGLTLDAAWGELERADAEWRLATGRAIEAQRRARRNSRRKSARAVGALASALRSGRVRRREILQELSGSDFLDVLPLWIGTLRDIDNTLPVVPAMFDVVIFDEASQIDQMRAAPGLARAGRAMVVGDPRQLRHVSFVSDDAMEAATAHRGLEPAIARTLDVRRNSLFDAAAAVSRVTWLDEHFRSVPHIIAFSDRHFYGGKLRLMTQHPATETRDAIRTVAVAGSRSEQGVNSVEIAAVLREIQAYAEAGARSIGVISPFRAQADAIEAAVLNVFGPEDVDRLGLRVGTVHAFQGNERDIVIASLAIVSGDPAGSWRFLQNPNLFNVLVTRAKREMVIVTSVDQDRLPTGLLADYLRHAEHPPLPSETAIAPSGWAGEIYTELGGFSMPVVAGYPVAGWTVDLAVGAGADAFGVECTVSPAGAETHIEQHLALRRAGWSLVDAYRSRWLTDPEGAAAMLSQRALAKTRERR